MSHVLQFVDLDTLDGFFIGIPDGQQTTGHLEFLTDRRNMAEALLDEAADGIEENIFFFIQFHFQKFIDFSNFRSSTHQNLIFAKPLDQFLGDVRFVKNITHDLF